MGRVAQWCWQRAKKWKAPPHWGWAQWQEELLAYTHAAALAAYAAYDPSQDVPLEAFLFVRVMGALRHYWRKEWQEARHRVSPLPKDEEESDPWEFALLTLQQEEREWQHAFVRWAVSQLGARERWVIERLFWDGWTEAEIARALSISQQMVSKIRKRALQRLKELLAG